MHISVCPDSGWTNTQSADTDQRHCGWVNVLRARLYKEQDSPINLRVKGNKIGHY